MKDSLDRAAELSAELSTAQPPAAKRPNVTNIPNVAYWRATAARSVRQRAARNRGFLTLELVVSAGLMLVVISVITSLAFRVRGVVQDTNEHRQALSVVANELERLTALSPDQAASAVQTLQPSPELLAALPDAQWQATLVDDDQGARIELELDWRRRHAGRPVRLVGWLLPHAPPAPAGSPTATATPAVPAVPAASTSPTEAAVPAVPTEETET